MEALSSPRQRVGPAGECRRERAALVWAEGALTGVDHQPLRRPLHPLTAPAGDEPHHAAINERANALAELAPGRERVVGAAAVSLAHALAPRRTAQVISVPDTSWARAASSSRALKAEWPLPATSTRRPA